MPHKGMQWGPSAQEMGFRGVPDPAIGVQGVLVPDNGLAGSRCWGSPFTGMGGSGGGGWCSKIGVQGVPVPRKWVQGGSLPGFWGSGGPGAQKWGFRKIPCPEMGFRGVPVLRNGFRGSPCPGMPVQGVPGSR